MARSLFRRVTTRVIRKPPVLRSFRRMPTYETDGLPLWWFLFRSLVRRHGVALPMQTEYLPAGRACLHPFLYSRRRSPAHDSNKTSTFSSYRHLGSRRSLWRALPCRVSPSHVHRRCVDRQLNSYHQESNDAENASRKEY